MLAPSPSPQATTDTTTNNNNNDTNATNKRGYVDAGTQYSPAGLPPTYRPAKRPSPAGKIEPAPPAVPAIAERLRGLASAVPAATEPSEPAARVHPQPVTTPAQNARPSSRRMSSESTREELQALAQKQGVTIKDMAASPAKRARPQDPNVKIMPLRYETCDVKDLGILISDMLMEIVRLNDRHPLRDGQLTRFHSRCVLSSYRLFFSFARAYAD